MNRKLLAILGSPHADGVTATMLGHAVRAAQAAGYDVTTVNLYETPLKPCLGCRACVRTGVCVQPDGMAEVGALLKSCDTIVLAAPTYWSNVPAVVKNLFDRALGIAMEETATFPKPRLSGKRYLLLTACNTPAPLSWMLWQSRGTVRCMDAFFKIAGMKSIGKCVHTPCAKQDGLPSKLIRKIERCFR